jgi:hypothetical protein
MNVIIPRVGTGCRGVHWLPHSVMPAAKLPVSTVLARILTN